MKLCEGFITEILYSYCKRPFHKKNQNVYNAECPICKEGKSSGRLRRLYYFVDKEYFYCHNCSRSWNPLGWVKEVTGLTLPEIIKRNKEKEDQSTQKHSLDAFIDNKKKINTPAVIEDLPTSSIDITDPCQLAYYKKSSIVNKAFEYCLKRHLLSACNSCNKFYVSLEDKIHKNRLIIPFFDNNKKIVSYQTRAINKDQFPRYLTKFGEKTLFNINNINPSIPYIFIFEGPIDSMFVRNGVAIAALSPTQKQQQLLQSFIGYDLIFVFDNDKNNKHTQKRIEKSIKEGKRIFIWPKEFTHFKDFNEICCKLQIDEIPWKFVVKNSAQGNEAMIKHKLLTSHVRTTY